MSEARLIVSPLSAINTYHRGRARYENISNKIGFTLIVF